MAKQRRSDAEPGVEPEAQTPQGEQDNTPQVNVAALEARLAAQSDTIKALEVTIGELRAEVGKAPPPVVGYHAEQDVYVVAAPEFEALTAKLMLRRPDDIMGVSFVRWVMRAFGIADYNLAMVMAQAVKGRHEVRTR